MQAATCTLPTLHLSTKFLAAGHTKTWRQTCYICPCAYSHCNLCHGLTWHPPKCCGSEAVCRAAGTALGTHISDEAIPGCQAKCHPPHDGAPRPEDGPIRCCCRLELQRFVSCFRAATVQSVPTGSQTLQKPVATMVISSALTGILAAAESPNLCSRCYWYIHSHLGCSACAALSMDTCREPGQPHQPGREFGAFESGGRPEGSQPFRRDH